MSVPQLTQEQVVRICQIAILAMVLFMAYYVGTIIYNEYTTVESTVEGVTPHEPESPPVSGSGNSTVAASAVPKSVPVEQTTQD